MKRLLFYLLILVTSCNISNRKIELFNINGMDGESVYLCFINSKVGYSFNVVTKTNKQTTEQLNDVNFFPKSTDVSTIYETLDGGRNWHKVFSITDFRFYNTYFYAKNSVYIKLIDSKKVLKNKLLKFNINNNKVSILNYNFERMGEIWSVNENIYINSKNKGLSYLYVTDTNFYKMDSIQLDKVFKGKITLLENTPYVNTWDDEIYNINTKQSIKFDDNKIECIIKKGKSNLLIASKNLSSITLMDFNIKNNNKEILKKFEGYSIINNLQSNDKIICGFIGNINGLFTDYDLFYSLDNGNTWQITELIDKNYIQPCTLIENELLIIAGGKKMQKINFPAAEVL